MDYDSDRQRFIKALESVVGLPYHWGGEDPEIGLDCSGTVRYCWIMAGFHMANDHTAHMMCNEFWKDYYIDKKDAQPGDLFFYGHTPAQINHVMIVFRKWPNGKIILAGARGGSSITVTSDIAYSQWALVDVCSERYWQKNFQYAVNPFLKLDKEPANDKDMKDIKADYEQLIKSAQMDATAINIAEQKPKKGFFSKWLL